MVKASPSRFSELPFSPKSIWFKSKELKQSWHLTFFCKVYLSVYSRNILIWANDCTTLLAIISRSDLIRRTPLSALLSSHLNGFIKSYRVNHFITYHDIFTLLAIAYHYWVTLCIKTSAACPSTHLLILSCINQLICDRGRFKEHDFGRKVNACT